MISPTLLSSLVRSRRLATYFETKSDKCRFVKRMFSIFVGFFVLLEIILTQKVSKEGTMIMFWDQGWKIRSRPFSPPTTSFFSRKIGFPFSFQAPVTLSYVTQLQIYARFWAHEVPRKIKNISSIKKGTKFGK